MVSLFRRRRRRQTSKLTPTGRSRRRRTPRNVAEPPLDDHHRSRYAQNARAAPLWGALRRTAPPIRVHAERLENPSPPIAMSPAQALRLAAGPVTPPDRGAASDRSPPPEPPPPAPRSGD